MKKIFLRKVRDTERERMLFIRDDRGYYATHPDGTWCQRENREEKPSEIVQAMFRAGLCSEEIRHCIATSRVDLDDDRFIEE